MKYAIHTQSSIVCIITSFFKRVCASVPPSDSIAGCSTPVGSSNRTCSQVPVGVAGGQIGGAQSPLRFSEYVGGRSSGRLPELEKINGRVAAAPRRLLLCLRSGFGGLSQPGIDTEQCRRDASRAATLPGGASPWICRCRVCRCPTDLLLSRR